MKFLKILLIIIAVIGAIVVIGGLLLPKEYAVERSIVIKAPDSVVYNNVADFEEFYKWNPWSKMDPKAKVNYNGTPATVGHSYEWNGEESGNGTMTITNLEANKMVDIDLHFIKPMESKADTKFTLTPETDGTKITWHMTGVCDGIISKWFGVMMDGMIGKDFESGLANLKNKVEKGD